MAGSIAVPKREMPVSSMSMSPYGKYVTKMNEYLDKNDKDHQLKLKAKNRHFIERNEAEYEQRRKSLLEK